jgi:hypothetical protein
MILAEAGNVTSHQARAQRPRSPRGYLPALVRQLYDGARGCLVNCRSCMGCTRAWGKGSVRGMDFAATNYIARVSP